MIVPIVNIFLRILSAASRFFLLFFVVKNFEPEDVGYYGLLTASVSLAVYAVGLDFYVFNSRELLQPNCKSRIKLMKDQVVLHLLLYVFALLAALVLVQIGEFGFEISLLFLCIVVCEHFIAETYRWLVTFSRPLEANLIYFSRGGGWMILFGAYALISPASVGINTVLGFWLAGGVFGLLLSARFLINEGILSELNRSIDWAWIKKGVKTSMLFLISSLSMMALLYADRYFIENYVGRSEVGVYTFYIGLTGLFILFLEAGVFSIFYPKLVGSFQADDIENYNYNFRKMVVNLVAFSLVLLMAFYLLVSPVFYFLDKPIYSENIQVLYVLLGSQLIFCLSYIPLYPLLVRQWDYYITYSSVFSVLVAIALNFWLIPKYFLLGAAYTTLVAYSLLFLSRLFFVMYGLHNEKPSGLSSKGGDS